MNVLNYDFALLISTGFQARLVWHCASTL